MYFTGVEHGNYDKLGMANVIIDLFTAEIYGRNEDPGCPGCVLSGPTFPSRAPCLSFHTKVIH